MALYEVSFGIAIMAVDKDHAGVSVRITVAAAGADGMRLVNISAGVPGSATKENFNSTRVFKLASHETSLVRPVHTSITQR